jgi:hypothetical protein
MTFRENVRGHGRQPGAPQALSDLARAFFQSGRALASGVELTGGVRCRRQADDRAFKVFQ